MPPSLTSYGASSRGPIHRSHGVQNQDAWLRTSGKFGSLIVVCDGMGSRPEARKGAQAACIAAHEAVVKWVKVQNAPVSLLAHLIEIFWRLRIHPISPIDAASTCLLAFVCPSGYWVVGGIGDGLLVVKTGDDPVVQIIGERSNNFTNETTALGASTGIRSWNLVSLPPTPLNRLAVLATDGIADDIIPEKLDGFCNWIVDEFQNLEPAVRWRSIMSELRNWPTPKHLDDKTIAVLSAYHGQSGELICP
ncbi:MAG: protein phosphatase 2C domain-containing protein [Calditrichaeota bacterium]|jgi:hypothetical protein|nr:protein phosphatase 2C domain-containing protein [Calditrichota bacterium]